jgi:hypothetical protein
MLKKLGARNAADLVHKVLGEQSGAQLLGRSEFAGKPASRIGPERTDRNVERFKMAAGRALERKFLIADRVWTIPAHSHRMSALAARRPLGGQALHTLHKSV